MPGQDELRFGVPKSRVNRSGNDEIEWADGLKIVRMEDGRVKIGRQGGEWRVFIATSPFYSGAGSNPTTHAILGFERVTTK